MTILTLLTLMTPSHPTGEIPSFSSNGGDTLLPTARYTTLLPGTLPCCPVPPSTAVTMRSVVPDPQGQQRCAVLYRTLKEEQQLCAELYPDHQGRAATLRRVVPGTLRRAATLRRVVPGYPGGCTGWWYTGWWYPGGCTGRWYYTHLVTLPGYTSRYTTLPCPATGATGATRREREEGIGLSTA